VELPIGDAEFSAAAELARTGWRLPPPAPWQEGEPLRVAWVCTPPAPGSGGHTTMFRLADALVSAGHQSTVYLMDRHQGEFSRHLGRVRTGWPALRSEIRDLAGGIADCHAVFATGWESAWTLLGSSALGLRCYLVQDFEPSFYPAGSEYLLAEATYRFGFTGVTAGRWLPSILDAYGMESRAFDFGCDLETYRLAAEPIERDGICYYCRPSTPRRAHELAVAGLRLFARRNPGTPIHFYGERVGDLGFAVEQHGTLSPVQLNELYNRCAAGLVLSATNVSLVPHEMLASGCVPVVNDAPQNRLVLANDHIAYTEATPHQIAEALETLVRKPEPAKQAAAVGLSASVSGRTWTAVGLDFVDSVRDLVRAAQAS
jgi:glycosyltransferase involved in cell wall biosynthesis